MGEDGRVCQLLICVLLAANARDRPVVDGVDARDAVCEPTVGRRFLRREFREHRRLPGSLGLVLPAQRRHDLLVVALDGLERFIRNAPRHKRGRRAE